MKATDKSLFITILLFTLGIILIGMTWFIPAILVRIIATVALMILCGWMGIFGDVQMEVRGEWNRKTIKRCKRRLMDAINQEPFGVLTDRDVENIFKELENEV